MFYILRRYYRRFRLFFEEVDLPFHAHDMFITEILSNFECKIFQKNEVIIWKGSPASHLYFVSKGSVSAYTDIPNNEDATLDPKKLLFSLISMSWFGDYQTLTQSNSNLNFLAAENGTVLYCVKGKKFNGLCQKYTGHHCFYLERALSRRWYWKWL